MARGRGSEAPALPFSDDPVEPSPSKSVPRGDPAKARQRPLPSPPVLDRHGPAKVIALCNHKGGVGKTTSTINLGAALAEFGRKVLLVDLDPQGALSVGLGVPPYELDRTVYHALMEPDVGIADVRVKTKVDGLDLIPSSQSLSAAEFQLVNEVGREQVLKRALRAVRDEYDFILIDCQPSLGLLTMNALTAAHGVIIPVECEYFSLRGVAMVVDTIDKVADLVNPDLKITGILATMYDPRTLHCKDVFARLVHVFGDTVFQTTITRTVRFPETTVAGVPITAWAPVSTGANAYRNLAKEVVAAG